MKRSLVSILCGSTALMLAMTSCGGDDSPERSEESAECNALGELCHPAEDGSEQAANCHDVGHAGDPDACEEAFDDCVDVCLEAVAEAGEGEAGASGDDFDLCGFLGSFCHHAEDDLGQECHEVGHNGDAGECLDRADECVHHCAEASHAEDGSHP